MCLFVCFGHHQRKMSEYPCWDLVYVLSILVFSTKTNSLYACNFCDVLKMPSQIHSNALCPIPKVNKMNVPESGSWQKPANAVQLAVGVRLSGGAYDRLCLFNKSLFVPKICWHLWLIEIPLLHLVLLKKFRSTVSGVCQWKDNTKAIKQHQFFSMHTL